MRNTAPATDRGRSRTLPPSLPERTIHWPLAPCPVIRPTWWGHTTTAPICGLVGRPQWAQFRARFISGPPPFSVLIHHTHQRAGLPPCALPPTRDGRDRCGRGSWREQGREGVKL